MFNDLVVAFIRKSDGDIYVRNPEIKDGWISPNSLSGSLGWPSWTTNLFMSYVSNGEFDVAFTEEAKTLLSNFYKAKKKAEEAKIKNYEVNTGECYHCKMILHNCLCSHEE